MRIIDGASATLGNISAALGAVTLGETGGDAITGAITQTGGTTIFTTS